MRNVIIILVLISIYFYKGANNQADTERNIDVNHIVNVISTSTKSFMMAITDCDQETKDCKINRASFENLQACLHK